MLELFKNRASFMIILVFSLLGTLLFSGSVQITGRVEFNYRVNPDFTLGTSNAFVGDNAAYLVVTANGPVMVVDMKYTSPNFTSIYVNELFVPWKVNDNLTAFFGYRNIADYDGFLGNAGSLKWAKNGVGILWYKSVFSLIYGIPGLMIEAGTDFQSTLTSPLSYVVLAKTSVGPVKINANVTGKIDGTQTAVGARLAYRISPFNLYLAVGYSFSTASITGLLIGLDGQVGDLGGLAEVDATEFDKVKLYGDIYYKFQAYKFGATGNYDFSNGKFVLQPYVVTKLGAADGRISARFEETGYKYLLLNVGFGF
ncbi:MAG: hypothetical protein WHS64_06655 [Fervidobacterium sp.]|uniref:Uncharacterized protein n=1 Tax=Fervidobacterium gondwanense DSM 13020 TaxID=1121883 RepID=A0A1M7TIT2_FERGO|nr:hypothetical protein [Fervidobacterium gondwanense]UXF00766.1 hypothetical protein IB67_04135 [Fervidobacterium riparium]SHN70543.1 hypothetical protein SAMN02745226_02040 [Fervidobacterium gondwanense DSM 13020]